MIRATYYQSPIGTLKVTGDDKTIRSILFVDREEKQEEEPSYVMKACVKQLDEYFSGKRISFDFHYIYMGTDFQRKVWQELEKIPYGTTTSYKNIALDLGSEKLVRTVGLANGKNPLNIVIPCHRVIGSSGKLVGFAGELWRKQWLLIHEQKFTSKKDKLF